MEFRIERHSAVTSTMDVCRAHAEHGALEGLVIVADEQTSGRGRIGRSWFSPSGQAIYTSVLLRPTLPPRRVSWLTMLGALAVCDLNSKLKIQDSKFHIKWFNDVLLMGRKLAGVLVETSFVGDRLDYAILGIGLNVNTRFGNAPADVAARAISLRDALDREFDRDDVLAALLENFGRRYDALPESPVADYTRHLDTLGQRVRLQVGDEQVEGLAVRVEDDGALVVCTAAGERVVRFGDLV